MREQAVPSRSRLARARTSFAVASLPSLLLPVILNLTPDPDCEPDEFLAFVGFLHHHTSTTGLRKDAQYTLGLPPSELRLDNSSICIFP